MEFEKEISTMSKVIVTYTEGKIGRKEVVQIEHPRFMDLVSRYQKDY